MKIYSSIALSKTNLKIPLFMDGQSFHSKYNPQTEAKQFINSIEPSEFFIITGLGGGYYIQELTQKYPNSKILIIESSSQDLDFLQKNVEYIQTLKQNKNIYFSTLQTLKKDMPLYYIPAIYNSFKVIECKSWINHIDKNLLYTSLTEAINTIKQDFSVQSHFGHIWQRNILSNLKQTQNISIKIPNNKTAVILAAGASLDTSIELIKNGADSYYIIATDTAYSKLLHSNIKCDAVVSIDGQAISAKHFHSKLNKNTLFVFDLVSSHCAVEKAIRNASNIVFSISGHPLEYLADNFSSNSFIKLNAGSGTVTIAALDFAIKAGFSNIEVFGADFSYINNKPYTKGTYLDYLYSYKSYRTYTIEQQFSSLMFRTELKEINKNEYTTDVLYSYKTSFESYLKSNNATFEYKNKIYKIKIQNKNKAQISLNKFNYTDFINDYLKNIEKFENTNFIEENINSNPYFVSLLPFIANLKNKDIKTNNIKEIKYYTNLASSLTKRYT